MKYICEVNLFSRSDKGRCYQDKVHGLDIDVLGLQSHMHSGINGDTLYHRLIDLADFDGELLVTEFDIDEPNALDKAEDVEDFMRIVYSHPDITGILTWTWLKLQVNENS